MDKVEDKLWEEVIDYIKGKREKGYSYKAIAKLFSKYVPTDVTYVSFYLKGVRRPYKNRVGMYYWAVKELAKK